MRKFSIDEVEYTRAHFKEHGPLLSIEVTGQDIPQPDDDAMAAVKTTVIDRVFPEIQRENTVVKQSI